jgi:hypothetical protein
MKEIRAVRNAPLWVGSIEDIFGYGFIVVADSEAECAKALKAELPPLEKGTRSGAV